MTDRLIYVPAGAWVRGRCLSVPTPRSRGGDAPEWDGLWHLATGDVAMRHGWAGGPRVKARCGYPIDAVVRYRYDGLAIGDVVVATDMPTIDVCTRCLRLSGLPVTITVRPREVTVEPA